MAMIIGLMLAPGTDAATQRFRLLLTAPRELLP
jgi:hypothetical protein